MTLCSPPLNLHRPHPPPPPPQVRQYYRLLQANRPPAWQQVALQLRNGEYLRLSQGLSHEPFSNVRAAALYLPWALLQNNEFAAASECRKAYNGFDDHVRDLEQVGGYCIALCSAASA